MGTAQEAYTKMPISEAERITARIRQLQTMLAALEAGQRIIKQQHDAARNDNSKRTTQ